MFYWTENCWFSVKTLKYESTFLLVTPSSHFGWKGWVGNSGCRILSCGWFTTHLHPNMASVKHTCVSHFLFTNNPFTPLIAVCMGRVYIHICAGFSNILFWLWQKLFVLVSKQLMEEKSFRAVYREIYLYRTDDVCAWIRNCWIRFV